MNAVNAAVPRPTPSASKAMTTGEQQPVRLVHVGEPREAEDRDDLHHAEQPQAAIDADPQHPDAAEQPADTLAHSPAFLAIRPISDIVKPMSR